MAALIWLIAGIALFAAEVLSGDLVLVMLGAGAVSAAGASYLFDNQYVAVAVFSVVSLGMLVLARPALKRRFLLGPGVRTNADALIGAQALTLSPVDAQQGRVKLAGEEWSARSYIEGQTIEPGTTVTVVEIAGATAVVSAEP